MKLNLLVIGLNAPINCQKLSKDPCAELVKKHVMYSLLCNADNYCDTECLFSIESLNEEVNSKIVQQECDVAKSNAGEFIQQLHHFVTENQFQCGGRY